MGVNDAAEMLQVAQQECVRLERQIAGALAEIEASMYGDPEVPFRVRAHLEPENRGKTFNVSDLKVEPGRAY